MNQELHEKIKTARYDLSQIVKDLQELILNNVSNEDLTANHYLISRLNTRYNEMLDQMDTYANTLTIQLHNIDWIIGEEKERGERK
jgi:hypothetical protein